ncbi:hypothetical protein BDV25DRAFT_142854 [Aspergillus avenaceus]|uniref:NAD(P)-binding protein n=1 Tax=Aspergillus avenaceus TaxID=36643 RepID=A0A5N6TLX3_ASPAV|nr:hypothetical protein BDV25DRAFT_142854 [Aspergillus avenaceus]
MVRVEDKRRQTVLITGCSAGGIGSALAEAFHKRNLHVFATSRSPSKMSHLENLPNMTLLELDVTSASSIASAVVTVMAETGGKLDYLINNSGQALVRPALDTDLEQAKGIFDVNLWGMAAVTQAFAPLVIAAKGTIVNNSGLLAVMNMPWNAFHAASKAAVKTYSETLRLEMAPLGVKVVTLMTGAVGTRLFANCADSELPVDSLYTSASKEIDDMAAGSLLANHVTASVYAKRVVNDVMKGASGMVWRGKFATTDWFLGTFFPAWFTEWGLKNGSGLSKISTRPRRVPEEYIEH